MRAPNKNFLTASFFFRKRKAKLGLRVWNRNLLYSYWHIFFRVKDRRQSKSKRTIQKLKKKKENREKYNETKINELLRGHCSTILTQTGRTIFSAVCTIYILSYFKHFEAQNIHFVLKSLSKSLASSTKRTPTPLPLLRALCTNIFIYVYS